MKDFPMRKHSSSRSHRRFQPGLEALEDRWVPSQLASHALHHHVHIVVHKVHGGTAVQNGASLTISAFNRLANTVQVKDGGAGVIQVNWNGGATHSFRGIDHVTIHVKGQTDDVDYTFTNPLTVLPSGAFAPGFELISVNLNGFNETFNFSGAGLQDNASLNVGVRATSTGSHQMTMNESNPVGANAFLVMEAFGAGSSNRISDSVTDGIGPGSNVTLVAVGSGTLRTVALGAVLAGAHLSMSADAGPTATTIANVYNGEVSKGASVGMDSQGSPGNDTIDSTVTMGAGSQGNFTATEEGFDGDDTLTLQTVGSTTGTTNFSVDGGVGHNTANVSPGVQVSNCQVVNPLP
jgi:hypothetical protein